MCMQTGTGLQSLMQSKGMSRWSKNLIRQTEDMTQQTESVFRQQNRIRDLAYDLNQ
jgi:hypothetical protein